MLKPSVNEPFHFWISREPQKDWRHLEHSRACNTVIRKTPLIYLSEELNGEFKLNVLEPRWRKRQMLLWVLWSRLLCMHLLSLQFGFSVTKTWDFMTCLMLCSIIWSRRNLSLGWWRSVLKEPRSILTSYDAEQRKSWIA